MVDILVRNVEDGVAETLKERARQAGTSMNDVVRQTLNEATRPSRRELVEQARRIRAAGRRYEGDSTDMIRDDRDNDEPRR